MQYTNMSPKEFCEYNAKALMQSAIYHYSIGNDRIANQFNGDACWWFEFAKQYEYKSTRRKFKHPYISSAVLANNIMIENHPNRERCRAARR